MEEEKIQPLLTHKSLWVDFNLVGTFQPSKVNELRYDKITYSEYYFREEKLLKKNALEFLPFTPYPTKLKISTQFYIFPT